jgi:hypothetical protein
MQRKTPLKSSGFKRESWKNSPVKSSDWRAELRSGGMKRRVKKPSVEEGSKYLAACKGEACFLRVLGVCVGRNTVVPCHSNQSKHGKGMGIKAKHEFTVPGCGACHAWIDQGPAPREVKFRQWDVAYARWVPARAAKMGLKEEESAGFDSSTDGNALAHTAIAIREAVSHRAFPAHNAVGDVGLSRCSAEAPEQRQAVRFGGCVDSGGSAQRDPDFG